MNFTLRKALQKPNPQSPVDASTLFGDQTPDAKRRGQQETMLDCPLSKRFKNSEDS